MTTSRKNEDISDPGTGPLLKTRLAFRFQAAHLSEISGDYFSSILPFLVSAKERVG
jgi:hypothetical protein